mgnify:CR=1 FL=1
MLFIEEDTDDLPASGDEWATSVKEDHSQAESWLAQKQREFLERGGKTQEIPTGYSTVAENVPLGPVSTVNDRYTVAEQIENRRKKEERQVKAQAAADAFYMEPLRAALASTATVTQIAIDLGVSRNKLQRLVKTYFPDAARADDFYPSPRDDRRACIVSDIRRAISRGVVGARGVADAAGISTGHLWVISKQEQLAIPKAKTGSKADTHEHA